MITRPSPSMIRVWDILDGMGKPYEKCGEYILDGYAYFPIALLPGPVIITARGRRPGGWEDNTQRVLADRFTAALLQTDIPFLYGRNTWDIPTWEVRIKSLFMRIDAGECPQIIGRPMRRYNEHHKSKAYD